MSVLERDSTYWNLVQAIGDRQVVLFVGAGFSSALRGASSWSKCLELLAEKSEKNAELPKSYSAYFAALARRSKEDALFAADQWAHYLPDGEFVKALERAVGAGKRNDRAVEKRLIDFLALPFQRTITTNYDGALVQALETTKKARIVDYFTNRNVEEFSEFLAGADDKGRVNVLHLHGHFDDPESIVLGESQYQRLYARQVVANALETIFTTRSVLFLGFSGNDDDVMHVIRRGLARFPSSRERHFLIRGSSAELKPEERWVERLSWNYKYGIGTVDYPVEGMDHSALIEGVAQLAQDVNAADPAPTAPRRIAVLMDRGFPFASRLASLVDHLNRVQHDIRYEVQADRPTDLIDGFSRERTEKSMTPAIDWARARSSDDATAPSADTFDCAFLYTDEVEGENWFYADKKRVSFVSTGFWSRHIVRPSIDDFLLHMTAVLTVHFYAYRSAEWDQEEKSRLLEPHDPDVGCIFDYTEELRSRVAVIDYPRLCARCKSTLSRPFPGRDGLCAEPWLRRVIPIVDEAPPPGPDGHPTPE